MEPIAARAVVFSPVKAIVLVLVTALALSASGCSGGNRKLSGDPLTDFQNPELRTPQRLAAMRAAWDDPGANRSAIRGPLKELAWSDQTPREIRHQAVDLLLGDDSRTGQADTFWFIQSRVPTERDYEIVRKMGVKAVAQSWSDLTPAFVRSYAIADTNIPDGQRVEKAILESLNPDQPLALIVSRVFLNPQQGSLGTPGANNYIDLDAKAREAAWDLLARIDPSGEARRDVLARGDLPTDEQGARVLADIRRGIRELGVVPRNGEELRWLLALAAERSGGWWSQTALAVAQLTQEQAAGLKLRNLEALRWASIYRETWMRDDRAQLEGRLRARLADREVTLRRADSPELRGVPQTLEQAADLLSWGDVLSVLAVDVALHDPAVTSRLFEQVDMDRADETTEYGGLIFVDSQGRFVAQLYPPRPQHRKGDDQFVASSDMIEQSVRALAMYHFHAMRERNSRFAGPSAEDYANARTFGRLSIVLTSINKDELNADVYFDTPASVDLGQRPRTPAFVGQN
ncbi:MAG: hypothetical protein KIT54_09370 [Phycisphaeraceae bacterium]|nr:hypothetical protein [Phycisphaeraceae bacterium]